MFRRTCFQTGTATAWRTSTFAIRATDQNGLQATRRYPIGIYRLERLIGLRRCVAVCQK